MTQAIQQKFQTDHKLHRNGEAIALPYPHGDKGCQQAHQAHRTESEYPHGDEIDSIEYLELFLVRLRHAHIAHASTDGTEYDLHRRFQGGSDHQVVGIDAHRSQIYQPCHQQVVRSVDQNIPHFVVQHRTDIALNGSSQILRQLFLFLNLEERVQVISFFGEQQILRHGKDNHQGNIQEIIPGDQQTNGLHHIQGNGTTISISGNNVLLLIRNDQRTLVGIQVGKCRVQHKQNINQPDTGDIGEILDEILQKRSQRQSRRKHKGSHQSVNPAEHLHQPTDGLLVFPGKGAIEAKGDRFAKAQLRQRQHHQNIGKQSSKAKVFPTQHLDKHRATHKLNQYFQEISGERIG